MMGNEATYLQVTHKTANTYSRCVKHEIKFTFED